MRPRGDAHRKHRLVEEGREWIGRADSKRWHIYIEIIKSKEAGKKKCQAGKAQGLIVCRNTGSKMQRTYTPEKHFN